MRQKEFDHFFSFSGRFRSLFGHFFWCFCHFFRHFFAKLLLPDSFCVRVSNDFEKNGKQKSCILFQGKGLETKPPGRGPKEPSRTKNTTCYFSLAQGVYNIRLSRSWPIEGLLYQERKRHININLFGRWPLRWGGSFPAGCPEGKVLCTVLRMQGM